MNHLLEALMLAALAAMMLAMAALLAPVALVVASAWVGSRRPAPRSEPLDLRPAAEMPTAPASSRAA